MRGVKFTAKEKLKALSIWSGKSEDTFIIAKKYKCTERSLWRWKSVYNGTLESLDNKSSRPHTPHPKAHTTEEREHILQIYGKSPNIGYTELYGELRANFAYNRHFMAMYNFIRKNNLRPSGAVISYGKYVPQEYDTPPMLGVKMQMDVKFVPTACLRGQAKKNLLEVGEKYYQYTMIDEATRERFIYPYREHCGFSTVDFVKRAILYFGYVPACIQTDNGAEFTNPKGTGGGKVHAVDVLLNRLCIEHLLIRPYTPRHNGKVERSHRNDQERFYRFLTFETYDELREKMEAYLIRSNRIPSAALTNRDGKHKWQSPLEKRAELIEVMKDGHNIRFLKNSQPNRVA